MIVFELRQKVFADYFKEVGSLNWVIADSHDYIIWGTEPLLVDRLGKIQKELRGNSGFISALKTVFIAAERTLLTARSVYTISLLALTTESSLQ